MIGGFSMKSISGGERKRTCIGYELITDANLLNFFKERLRKKK